MKKSTCDLLRLSYWPGIHQDASHAFYFLTLKQPSRLGATSPCYTGGNRGSGSVLPEMTQLVRSRAIFHTQLLLQILCSPSSDILPRSQCLVLQISSPSKLMLVIESSLPSPSHVNNTPFPATAAQYFNVLENRFLRNSLPSGWLQKSKAVFFFFFSRHLPLSS